MDQTGAVGYVKNKALVPENRRSGDAVSAELVCTLSKVTHERQRCDVLTAAAVVR